MVVLVLELRAFPCVFNKRIWKSFLLFSWEKKNLKKFYKQNQCPILQLFFVCPDFSQPPTVTNFRWNRVCIFLFVSYKKLVFFFLDSHQSLIQAEKSIVALVPVCWRLLWKLLFKKGTMLTNVIHWVNRGGYCKQRANTIVF